MRRDRKFLLSLVGRLKGWGRGRKWYWMVGRSVHKFLRTWLGFRNILNNPARTLLDQLSIHCPGKLRSRAHTTVSPRFFSHIRHSFSAGMLPNSYYSPNYHRIYCNHSHLCTVQLRSKRFLAFNKKYLLTYLLI